MGPADLVVRLAAAVRGAEDYRCAPWKGGTFPVGERPTRRSRSRRKQPEQSYSQMLILSAVYFLVAEGTILIPITGR
jgi:hypothetical protein